jgi:hypothetical protein
LKNWILILALLSLHGCKVFNQGITVSNDSLLTIHAEPGIADASHDSQNTTKSFFLLHAITGEEEYDFFLLPSSKYIDFPFDPFLFLKEDFSYCLKNFPPNWRVPLYLSFKRLIL